MNAAELAGIAYVRGGRDALKDGGLDCWGFFRHARRLLGMSVPPEEVVDESENDGAIDERRNSPSWVKLDRPEPGCLVLIRRNTPGSHYHVGMVLEDCVRFAHCMAGGSRIDRLDCPVFSKKIKGYYRYSGARNGK